MIEGSIARRRQISRREEGTRGGMIRFLRIGIPIP